MKKTDDWLKGYVKYSSLAFQMVGIVVAGFFLGHFIDKKLGLSKPLFALLLSVLFIFIIVFYMIRNLMKK